MIVSLINCTVIVFVFRIIKTLPTSQTRYTSYRLNVGSDTSEVLVQITGPTYVWSRVTSKRIRIKSVGNDYVMVAVGWTEASNNWPRAVFDETLKGQRSFDGETR